MTKRKRKNPVKAPEPEEIDTVRPHPARKFLWTIPLLIAFFFNLSALNNTFVWDDYDIFEHQIPALKSARDIFFPAEKIPELGKHYFRPFVLASYKVDHALWGKDPKGFHLTVLLSHCLNTLLVYFLALLAASGIKSKYIIALFSSALFAVHPAHAEVVGWICGRNESLSTNFILLAMISYVLFRQKDNIAFLFISSLCFLIGLFFKELAVSLLLLIPLYDVCFAKEFRHPPKTKKRATLFAYALFGAVFLLYYILRRTALGGLGTTILKSDIGVARALICSIGYYLRVLFAPLHLNFFISKIPSSNASFFIGLAALAGILYAAARSFLDNKRVVTFSALFFLFALFPSLAIAVMYISETPIALRYAYLPSVGFVLCLGYFLGNIKAASLPKMSVKEKAQCLIFLAVFIFYQHANTRALKVWKDDISLWTHVSRESPHEGLAYNHLGRAYALLGQYDQAIENSKKALATEYNTRGKAITCNTLGYSYLQLNDLEEAERWYRKALEFRPDDYALPYYNLGFISIRREEELAAISRDPALPQREAILQDAIPLFKKAIEIHPHYYKAHYYLGLCYVKLGQRDLAKKQFLRLLELSPSGQWADEANNILRQIP